MEQREKLVKEIIKMKSNITQKLARAALKVIPQRFKEPIIEEEKKPWVEPGTGPILWINDSDDIMGFRVNRIYKEAKITVDYSEGYKERELAQYLVAALEQGNFGINQDMPDNYQI